MTPRFVWMCIAIVAIGGAAIVLSHTPRPKDCAIDVVKKFGADPTGRRDSTAAFQAAIDYAIANDMSYLPFCPPGTYKIESPINLK